MPGRRAATEEAGAGRSEVVRGAVAAPGPGRGRSAAAAVAAAASRAGDPRGGDLRAGDPHDSEPAVPPPSGLAAATGRGPAAGPRAGGRPRTVPAHGPGSRSSGPEAPGAPRPGGLDPHDGLFGAPPSGWEGCTTLDELGKVASGCTRCPLAQTRNTVVFGSGNPLAELMFIGEGPGAEEDRQGLPFVGPAGELLTKIIGAIGLDRSQVYIANIVKCRPPGNRDPLPEEVKACRGYLERQIDLIRPRVIVALGRVAAQTLLESELPLGRLRGRWHSVRGIAVRVTYHPAALLRNASWKRPTWEDMKMVQARLQG